MKMSWRWYTTGFSLVELSIVLVILGLLVGGILGGQSLIRAAQLRSIYTDISKFQTAANAFREKYRYPPGDLATATDYWGAAHATPGTCYATVGTGTQTCNGDGDGKINFANTIVSGWEPFGFWKHLVNAGMMDGGYTGASIETPFTGNWQTDSVIYGPNGFSAGVNVPKSKIEGVVFSVNTIQPVTSSAQSCCYVSGYGQTLLIGKIFSMFGMNFSPIRPALIPEDAMAIDTKIDDGKPGMGGVMVFKPAYNANCATTDVPSTAVYNLSYADAACALIVPFSR